MLHIQQGCGGGGALNLIGEADTSYWRAVRGAFVKQTVPKRGERFIAEGDFKSVARRATTAAIHSSPIITTRQTGGLH